MSDENGENEATEQFEEENQDEVEEAPENIDSEGGRHCDLFGELNVPAGEEASAETEETEETNESKGNVQDEEENAEQNDAEETTDKTTEEETTEAKESTEDKDGEKPAEETEGDQQEQSDAQSGTKTNSDRQQDIFSRVFVGHLPTDRCNRTDVEKLFSQYGTITGCSVLNGYGFVQYKTPDSVDEAIRHLHGHHFFGANIGNAQYTTLIGCKIFFNSC